MANYRLRIGFSSGYQMTAAQGSYTLTGQSATLSYVGGSSAITSSVLSSRTYGTAPLFIHFDATGTTSSVPAITSDANGRAFRNIQHAFDFGDVTAGSWSTTALPRNLQTGGPIVSHVFETPGTYTVNVTHTHSGTGAKTATPIIIRVDDPAVNNSGLSPAGTNYSGANTICVSASGSSTPAGPAGCSYATTVSIASTLQNNKRYLLRKGESFTIPSNNWNGVYIGAYGTGADPIILTQVQQFGTTGKNVVQDCTIRECWQWVDGQHNLLSRCDILGIGSGFESYIAIQTHVDYIWRNKYICFFENSINTASPSDIRGGAGFWGICAWAALLGNSFNAHDQHSIRIPTAYKTCLAHNYVPGLGPYSVGQMLKLHSTNTNPSYVHWDEVSTANAFIISEFNVIANNIFGHISSTKGGVVNISPQNTESVEDLNDCIFENNEMRKTADGSQTDIGLGGVRLTERGNFRTGGGSLTTSENVHNPRINGPYFHI